MDRECIQLMNDHYDISGVYCFTHLPTGKKYIGSSVHIGKRVWLGLLDYTNKAMEELLLCEMKFSVLEVCPRDIDYLRVREADWIDVLGTMHPRGLNIANPIENKFNFRIKKKSEPSKMIYNLNKQEKVRLSRLKITGDIRIRKYTPQKETERQFNFEKLFYNMKLKQSKTKN